MIYLLVKVQNWDFPSSYDDSLAPIIPHTMPLKDQDAEAPLVWIMEFDVLLGQTILPSSTILVAQVM